MNTTHSDLPTEALRSAADDLSRRYAAGELSASAYREQLQQLKVQAAQVDAGDTPPEAPAPTRHRGPVKRTATSAKPKARETR